MGLISYKKTELYNTIKYTPTVIIVSKGKVIDYIDAEKKEHLKYYDSNDEFEKWLLSYVEMK